MLRRTVRLIALSNDAFALAAANFHLPIHQWGADSKSTQTVSSVRESPTWRLYLRTVNQLVGLNPDGRTPEYATLQDRLVGLPRGYSWKIQYLRCLYESPSDLHMLDWHRDTIHQSFSTEETFQSYILNRIEKVWQMCQEHYEPFEGIQLQQFRPSLLVLEAIDGNEELAGNLDFLLNILGALRSESNPISKTMYDIVWRVERKRGTWEYVPYET